MNFLLKYYGLRFVVGLLPIVLAITLSHFALPRLTERKSSLFSLFLPIVKSKEQKLKRRCPMKTVRIFLAFLVIFGTVIVLYPRNSCAAEPYKIGFIVALTGPASSLGENEHKAAIMAEEEVNKAGGINGHPFKLIVYDDQSDPSKGVLAAKRLIQSDKVCGILGPSTTPLSLPVIPIADEAGIPLISLGSAIKVVDPVRPYIFKVAPHGVIPYRRIYESFIKARGLKKLPLPIKLIHMDSKGKTHLN